MLFECGQFQRNRRRGGFTLVELLVVMAVIGLMVAVSMPAIKSMSRSNDVSQGANLVRAMISNARATAVAQHRMAGVVFFEETTAYSLPVHGNQTAMQIIVEDYNPAGGAGALTFFNYFSAARQYLPEGIRIAMLSDSQANGGTGLNAVEQAGGAAVVSQTRVILFDANGQLVLRNGLATADPGAGGAGQGTYPFAYGDWMFLTPAGTRYVNGSPIAGDAVSSPGFFLYGISDLNSQGFGNDDAARANWIRRNATVVIVNANTGNVSR